MQCRKLLWPNSNQIVSLMKLLGETQEIGKRATCLDNCSMVKVAISDISTVEYDALDEYMYL